MSKENPAPTPPSPSMQLFRFIWPGPMVAQAIHVAAALGIADHLHPTPRSISDLAAATNTHPESLRRLLRSLKSVGIFSEDESGKFQNTAMSDCLRRDHPESIRA
jgi:Dimerisation domain